MFLEIVKNSRFLARFDDLAMRGPLQNRSRSNAQRTPDRRRNGCSPFISDNSFIHVRIIQCRFLHCNYYRWFKARDDALMVNKPQLACRIPLRASNEVSLYFAVQVFSAPAQPVTYLLPARHGGAISLPEHLNREVCVDMKNRPRGRGIHRPLFF